MLNNKTLKLLQNNTQKNFTEVAKVINNSIYCYGDDSFLIINNPGLESGFYDIKKIKDTAYLASTKIENYDKDLPDLYNTGQAVYSFQTNKEIIETFEKSLPFNSKEASRYYICGTFLDLSNSSLVATDGHRLYKKVVDFKPIVNKPAESIEAASIKGFIISTDAVEKLVDLSGLFGSCIIELNERYFKAYNDHFTYICKVIDGNYPDYLRVIPDKTEKPGFELDLKSLKKTLKTWKFEKYDQTFSIQDHAVSVNNVKIGDLEVFNPGFKVGFNAKYINDLPNFPTVIAYIDNPNSPLRLDLTNDELAIVMPVRV
jgi:DNA polymerase-3 subunit beta